MKTFTLYGIIEMNLGLVLDSVSKNRFHSLFSYVEVPVCMEQIK